MEKRLRIFQVSTLVLLLVCLLVMSKRETSRLHMTRQSESWIMPRQLTIPSGFVLFRAHSYFDTELVVSVKIEMVDERGNVISREPEPIFPSPWEEDKRGPFGLTEDYFLNSLNPPSESIHARL